jgi:chemotaxis protein MotD
MNSGVKQAGFPKVSSPQETARPNQKKDAPDTAFNDIMQHAEIGLRRTGTSTARQRWDGAGAGLGLAPTPIGQPWHTAAGTHVETAPEGENVGGRSGLELEADTSRKPLTTLAESRTSKSTEDGPEANDEQSGIGMPLAITTFANDTNRQTNGQRTNSVSSIAGSALAAAGGSASQLLRTTTPGSDRSPGAPESTIVLADGSARTGKIEYRAMADSSNFPLQPAALSSETEQQGSDAGAERASLEPPERLTAGEIARETRPAEPTGTNSKVNVVSTQTIPAPAASAANATTAAFVGAISADPVWKASTSDAATHLSLHARPQPGAIQSLRIQLHPAELGMVTANLRFAGEQLSVEIKVESVEAYHRLNSDTDTIVKAFRALGYEIDQIAIQQPQANNQSARTDAGAANSAAVSRDLQSAFSGNSGGAGARFGGSGQNAEGGHDGRQTDGGGPLSHDRASRGLYI